MPVIPGRPGPATPPGTLATDAELAAAIAAATATANATYATLDGVADDLTGTDFAPVTDAVETVTTGVYFIQTLDGVAYGYDITLTNKLYKSIDNGATWTLVNTVPSGAIVGIHKVLSGEVVVITSGSVVKSSGWASNPAAATWTTVATRTTNGGTNPDASFIGTTWDAWGDFVLIAEYVTPDRTNSRYLRLSTDGGSTFTTKFDLNTYYPGSESLTHFHGVAIDPFHSETTPRLWFTHGDGPRGVFYSDNLGSSWTLLTGTDSVTAPIPQMMTVTATPAGVVFTTDASFPDGVWRVLRKTTPADMALEMIYRLPYHFASDTLLGFGTRAWRDPDTNVVYMTWITTTPGTGTVALPTWVFASDGVRAYPVWTSASTGTAGQSVSAEGVGVTTSGKLLIGYRNNAGTKYLVVATAPKRGVPPYVEMNAGNQLHGRSTTRDGVGIGYGAVARGNSVVVGPLSASATATTNSTLVGSEVVGGTHATGLGYKAGGATARTQTTAIGSACTVGADETIAIGYNASASGVRSAALGNSAAAAGIDQVILGHSATGHASAGSAVVIGKSAAASGAQTSGVAIGGTANTSGASAVAIGYGAAASSYSAVALGASAAASANTGAMALGPSATCAHQDSVALGRNATTTRNNQISVGTRHFEMFENTQPAGAPAANGCWLYVEDNGSGKTRLMAIFNTGAAQQVAIQP